MKAKENKTKHNFKKFHQFFLLHLLLHVIMVVFVRSEEFLFTSVSFDICEVRRKFRMLSLLFLGDFFSSSCSKVVVLLKVASSWESVSNSVLVCY